MSLHMIDPADWRIEKQSIAFIDLKLKVQEWEKDMMKYFSKIHENVAKQSTMLPKLCLYLHVKFDPFIYSNVYRMRFTSI